MNMTDYVRNVCRDKLIRGERLTGSDIWACFVNGVDVDALEMEVNNFMKED
jgi:hypothetical protein